MNSDHKPFHAMQRRDVLGLALVGIAAAVLPSQRALADSVDTLKNFLQNVSSLRAKFTQVVVSSQNDRTRTSSGTFVLSRPNRFRFDYLKPYEQQIISDGQNLWLYDVDLEQVTQREYSSAMGSTPAALLAGGAQATMAQQNFTLQSAPDADGQQWIEAKPRQEEGQIRGARIGFREQTLATLQIVDNFGQTSTLTFSDVEINQVLSDTLFTFKVPDGVDLITE
ncbi:outer membrane lipoprotein chaperone LolA [Saezia sanguinis]|uniref:outer membrane lipoprotein chaperone LolA n=1 Tax=Saezia sanguinis TaxID=1965230 RepID=UPI003044DA6F